MTPFADKVFGAGARPPLLRAVSSQPCALPSKAHRSGNACRNWQTLRCRKLSRTQAGKKATKRKKVAAAVNAVAAAPLVGPAPPSEELKPRLFSLRQRGYNRLYQHGRVFEFSTPESLLDVDFSQPVYILVDRLAVSPEIRQRLIDSVELSLPRVRRSHCGNFLSPDPARRPGALVVQRAL